MMYIFVLTNGYWFFFFCCPMDSFCCRPDAFPIIRNPLERTASKFSVVRTDSSNSFNIDAKASVHAFDCSVVRSEVYAKEEKMRN